MAKLNCWEFKHCGREAGGTKSSALGVCPAAVEKKLEGKNSGINGGRTCWGIVGTLCEGKIQGTFASKYQTCKECEFFMLVNKQEDPCVGTKEIVDLLRGMTK